MATVVVLGAGISGHTTALHLKRLLGADHRVVAVEPKPYWNWIPSNIWVGTGRMGKKDVNFELRPIYKRKGIEFYQGVATVIHPEGEGSDARPFVDIEYTEPGREGQSERLYYDYLVNATGPKLNFAATPGLGPDNGGHTVSVCTSEHAVHASAELAKSIEKMKAGENQTLVIGMGAGNCTCQGAAFEYTFNVDHELKRHGIRDKAEIIYFTNEAKLGDFGVDGMTFAERGFKQSSRMWTESLFTERGVHSVIGAAAKNITEDTIEYETIDGEFHELKYDFAMLLPPFTGQDLKAVDKDGEPLSELFNPANFMKVDADYTPKTYDEYRAQDWPETYQVPQYPNMFAVGIAFAPPHPISKGYTSPNGTVIAPAPPRTGMPSDMMGTTVAKTIADRIKTGDESIAHESSMARLGATCVASAGNGMIDGSAASMTMYPVVPNYEKYPDDHGRKKSLTTGKIGLGGHWMKVILHYLFIYKAKALPGWHFIP